MDKQIVRNLILVLVVLLVGLACDLSALPIPALSNPTPAPGSLETIVVATAGAAQTQTALVVPSPTLTLTPTLVPSLTSTETLTPTATIIFIIPTITNTPTATKPFSTQSAGSGCELVDQSPDNNTVYSSRERFTVEWRLRNTGSSTWQEDSYDFIYTDGRDMHDKDGYDLPRNVRAGNEVTLEVDMRAPANAGSYTSTWTLGTKNNALCRVSVTIIVK
ncbi:MAG: NBR1-Ig-like domain-containing protein [Anaerolineales bacterium]